MFTLKCIYFPEPCQGLPNSEVKKTTISGLVSSATAIFPMSSDQLGDVNVLVSVGSLYAFTCYWPSWF